MLATSIKNLELVRIGDQLTAGSIPSSVTQLVTYRPLAAGVIPNSVTHLEWNNVKPLQVGILPSSITNLKLYDSFNHPIPPGAIPSSVTHLTLGENFQQQIDPSFIPASVTHFVLRCFEILDHFTLPPSVYHLTLHLSSYHMLINPPPRVSFHRRYRQGEMRVWPDWTNDG